MGVTEFASKHKILRSKFVLVFNKFDPNICKDCTTNLLNLINLLPFHTSRMLLLPFKRNLLYLI